MTGCSAFTDATPAGPTGPTDSGAVEGGDGVEATGRFRIYLGAAPGVGKTVAMLDEAQRCREGGADVVVGFVETHGRPVTQARMAGLEMIPRRRVEYRGAVWEDMDVDAVLRRSPRVVLVDELAHTNATGSGRHEKRWQDVLELLEAGIDVFATVNIQHVDSLAQVVERLADIPVRERIPDWVVRRADEIELVDFSPQELRRRMRRGDLYPANEVGQALNHFFRVDNLSALRELTVRFLTDETKEELLEDPMSDRTSMVSETTERIMVGVSAAPGTDAIVLRAARVAARMNADLHVVHVTSRDTGRQFAAAQLSRIRQVVSDVGAEWQEINAEDPVEAMIDFARRHHITQIVIGPSQRSRWQEMMGGGSIVSRVARQAPRAELDVHIMARRPDVEAEKP